MWCFFCQAGGIRGKPSTPVFEEDTFVAVEILGFLAQKEKDERFSAQVIQNLPEKPNWALPEAWRAQHGLVLSESKNELSQKTFSDDLDLAEEGVLEYEGSMSGSGLETPLGFGKKAVKHGMHNRADSGSKQLSEDELLERAYIGQATDYRDY